MRCCPDRRAVWSAWSGRAPPPASTASSGSTWAARRPTCRTTRASSSAPTTPRSPASACAAPMIEIHTVAAGGGSVLHFDGARMRVGPDSAGADSRPGVLRQRRVRCRSPTATSCWASSGRSTSRTRSGPGGDEPLAAAASIEAFERLAAEISQTTRTEHGVASVATGFVDIAVDNMANAIKKISVQRGHDVSEYTLACFGGAGGQHACLVADRLGITRVHVHPHAGVLSAVGIGLADVRHVIDHAVEQVLSARCLDRLARCGRGSRHRAAPCWPSRPSTGRRRASIRRVASAVCRIGHRAARARRRSRAVGRPVRGAAPRPVRFRVTRSRAPRRGDPGRSDRGVGRRRPRRSAGGRRSNGSSARTSR